MIERATYQELRMVESKLIVKSVFQKKDKELKRFKYKVWLSEESVKEVIDKIFLDGFPNGLDVYMTDAEEFKARLMMVCDE